MHLEFLIPCGKYSRVWLANFYADILTYRTQLNEQHHNDTKPGKLNDLFQSYHSNALQNCGYELIEHVLYKRLSQEIYQLNKQVSDPTVTAPIKSSH